jgi:tetratricopeptide (TPR) repeat protein
MALAAIVALTAVTGGAWCAPPNVAAASPTSPLTLRDLLATTPADSLPEALRRFESAHPRTPEGTEALLALAELQYARGAYRSAAECYGRAAARLEPASKPEARYWSGLAWLALSESERARASLDEVASAPGPRQAAAMLAQAQLWELGQRPARAEGVLTALLSGDPGEVGPAALERSAALAETQGHSDEARIARERLVRDYPRSIEAAAARRAAFSPATPRASGRPRPGTSTAVVIGAFVDPARARSLAAAARAAGFYDAQVVSHGEGLSAIHLVRLGVYPGVAEARHAGVQAEQALGVTFEISRAD